MCGIAGYFGPKHLSQQVLNSALSFMHHRGPDHQGYKHWDNGSGKNVYLLHSRLSIIDLDPRSNQPMQRGDTWIAQNGELYNFLELRNELIEKGESFRTRSDTEVMLVMLEREGLSALARCEGMWAFGLYNQANKSLTLCRDRFGEKPLYIYQGDEGTFFASEIKVLAALLGRPLSIDKEHLLRYLVNGYKALYKQNCTFFEGVYELPSGTFLRFDANGSKSEGSYWQPEFNQKDQMSFDEAVEGARYHLIQSVDLRLRADVPLAFCMSGGVDSIALISIAKNVFDYDVHGYTIINSDARYEESDMVDAAVLELGLRHTPIPINTIEFLPRLRSLIRHHDAPIYTISYYVHWLLMQNISEDGYRISVSGSGADELFSGYYDHHLAYLYEIRNETPLYAESRNAWESHILPIVRNADLRNPERYLEDPWRRDHIFDGADFFRGFLVKPWYETFKEVTYTNDLLRNRMANELFCEAIPVILHEDDLNAMFYSIENRSPFLDSKLFEFCNTIPTRHLIRDGRQKAVLREALRGIAPDVILDNRRKVGFNAPIFSLLDVRDSSVRNELLADSPIFSILRRDLISDLLEQKDVGNSASKFLFNFVCAKTFLEEFSGDSV